MILWPEMSSNFSMGDKTLNCKIKYMTIAGELNDMKCIDNHKGTLSISSDVKFDLKHQDALPRPKTDAPKRYKAKQAAIQKKRDILDNESLFILSNAGIINEQASTEKRIPQVKNSNSKKEQAIPYPVGAYTSGYYSKLRAEQYSRPITPATITELLKLNSTIVDKSIKTPLLDQTLIEKSTNITRMSAHHAPTLQQWLPEPDKALIQEEAGKLTDIDASANIIIESLKELIEQCKIETGISLLK
jgi:hypothetical protein